MCCSSTVGLVPYFIHLCYFVDITVGVIKHGYMYNVCIFLEVGYIFIQYCQYFDDQTFMNKYVINKNYYHNTEHCLSLLEYTAKSDSSLSYSV